MKRQIFLILTFIILIFAWSEISSQSKLKELEIMTCETEEFILPCSQVIFVLPREFLNDWEQTSSATDYPKSITFTEKTSSDNKITIILRDFDSISKSEVVSRIKKKAQENDYKLSSDEEQTIEGKNIQYLLFQNAKQEIQGIYLVTMKDEAIAIEFLTNFGRFSETEKPLTLLLSAIKGADSKLINREIIKLNDDVNLILTKDFKYIIEPKNQIFRAENPDLTVSFICLENFGNLIQAASKFENILVKNKGFLRKSAERKIINQSEVIAFHGVKSDLNLSSLYLVKNNKNIIVLLIEYKDFVKAKTLVENIISELKYKIPQKKAKKIQPVIFLIDENEDEKPDYIEINLIFLDALTKVITQNLAPCNLSINITDFEKNILFKLTDINIEDYKNCILGGSLANKLRFNLNWLEKFKDTQYSINISADFGNEVISYRSRLIDILSD